LLTMADGTLKIAKLNNSNYQTWKFKVELLLIKDDLWDVVVKDPPDEVSADWQSKDRKARATIGLLIEIISCITCVRRQPLRAHGTR
jgi:hypothetical protein